MRQVPDLSWLILFSLLSISSPTDGTLVPLHWVTTQAEGYSPGASSPLCTEKQRKLAYRASRRQPAGRANMKRPCGPRDSLPWSLVTFQFLVPGPDGVQLCILPSILRMSHFYIPKANSFSFVLGCSFLFFIMTRHPHREGKYTGKKNQKLAFSWGLGKNF